MKRFICCALLVLSNAALGSKPDTLSVAQAREDLTALYEGLQSAHFDLFAHRDKTAYEQEFRDTLEQVEGPLSPFELFLVLQKFAAFGNVAHAKVDPPVDAYGQYRQAGGKAFPIYPRIIDGTVYVAEDYSGLDTVSAGDKIVAIDGIEMTQWLERLRSHISADSAYIADSLLESTFPTYLWIELGEQPHFAVTLAEAATQGKMAAPNRTVRVPALDRTQLMQEIEAAPEAFALDFSSREARLLDGGIAYLRPGPFYNVENPGALWDASAVVDFIDQAFERFLENEAKTLIVDLRNNPGGDNSFSDPMVQWIADRPFRFASKFLVRSSDHAAASNQARIDADPEAAEGMSGRYAKRFADTPRGEIFELDLPLVQPREDKRFTGEVYVLVNRKSYSNAVTTAAIFKDYGWATIVGEPTADNATTYGAMEHFSLPNSGMRVGFPKALIVRPNGDENVGGVKPDITIREPIVPTENDAMLDGLLAYLKSQ